ncbi:MAG TPA: hypothetical protein VGL71_12110, partial [Urbifossiella sp.]
QAIIKKPKALRAQARAFDRLQRQKLRRPNDQAETLAQIAEELKKLADEEDDVAKALSTGNASGGKGETDPMEKPKGERSDPKEEKPKEEGSDPKEEKKKGKGGMGGMDPTREKQDDIAGRASAIDKVAEMAKGLTGLAKSRITEAAKAANAGADAIGQGDKPMARREVDRARETFRAAAKQVSALAAEEASQQLAAARDLANDIASRAAPTDPMMMPGAGGDDGKKQPGLGGGAEDAKTLKDVLENLAGSGAEADAEAARKAAGVLKQEDLNAAIGRLEKLEKSDKSGPGDKDEMKDLAERFAALGQKLDQAYREAIAPRLEEIAKLEREANDLEQRAGAADDAADLRRLRQQASAFVERLEGAGFGTLAGDEFKNSLKSVNNRDAFGKGVALIHAKLVAKLQEFLAGDRFAGGNEAVPPQYKDLVERYLRTLSSGSSK